MVSLEYVEEVENAATLQIDLLTISTKGSEVRVSVLLLFLMRRMRSVRSDHLPYFLEKHGIHLGGIRLAFGCLHHRTDDCTEGRGFAFLV